MVRFVFCLQVKLSPSPTTYCRFSELSPKTKTLVGCFLDAMEISHRTPPATRRADDDTTGAKVTTA